MIQVPSVRRLAIAIRRARREKDELRRLPATQHIQVATQVKPVEVLSHFLPLCFPHKPLLFVLVVLAFKCKTHYNDSLCSFWSPCKEEGGLGGRLCSWPFPLFTPSRIPFDRITKTINYNAFALEERKHKNK